MKKLKEFLVMGMIVIFVTTCSSQEEVVIDCEDETDAECSSEVVEDSGMGMGGLVGAAGALVLVGVAAGASSSGSDSGGSDSGGSNDDTNTNEDTQPTETDQDVNNSISTRVEGIVALGKHSSVFNREIHFRQVPNAQVNVFDKNGSFLGNLFTDEGGNFVFEGDVDPTVFPIELIFPTDEGNYSSIIVTHEEEIVSHINEITTAIANDFVQNPEKTEEVFGEIAERVVIERFGENNAQQPHIPAEIFINGDFEAGSLGHLLLNAATGIGVDLTSQTENFFTNVDFLLELRSELQQGQPDFSELREINGNSADELIEILVSLARNNSTQQDLFNALEFFEN